MTTKKISKSKKTKSNNSNSVDFKEFNLDKVGSFGEAAEKLLEPLNKKLENSLQIIEKDPIMNANNYLKEINKDVNETYKMITRGNSFVSKIPLVGSIWSKLVGVKEDLSFEFKTVREKVEGMFEGFDISYGSLKESIGIQEDMKEDLEGTIHNNEKFLVKFDSQITLWTEMISQEKFKSEKSAEDVSRYNNFLIQARSFYNDFLALNENLRLSSTRLEQRLYASTQMKLKMQTSRPLFQTLLTNAVMEMSTAQALEMSLNTFKDMENTVQKIQDEQTNKTIESMQRTQQILNDGETKMLKLKENMEKLIQAIEDANEQGEAMVKKTNESKVKLLDTVEKLKNTNANRLENVKELEKVVS